MARGHHNLKTETEFFQEVERGLKKFEIRKNDRDFKQYDMVTLHEIVTVNGGFKFTNRTLGPFEIKYVFLGRQFGLEEGYCIFNW